MHSLGKGPKFMEKQADEKYCGDCGQIIKRRAEICPKCGIRQMDPPWAVNDLLERLSSGEYRKSKAAAILFAFFLGSFGAHKYYLGQIGTGILYTVFLLDLHPHVDLVGRSDPALCHERE